jgi:hypothetical protein
MIKYLDGERKKLEEGLYKNVENNSLLYFTGNYNDHSAPVFERGEKPGEEYLIYGSDVGNLFRLNKSEVKKIVQKLRENASWIEKKLKE